MSADIYDRSQWPSPQSNPLVLLLQRGDELYSNQEIVSALGLTPDRALLSSVAPTFKQALADGDTAVTIRGMLVPTSGLNRSHSGGGNKRMFSRRALVLAAMRTNTVNAAAFRDWIASEMAEIAWVSRLEAAEG